jgi:hypothetical protein
VIRGPLLCAGGIAALVVASLPSVSFSASGPAQLTAARQSSDQQSTSDSQQIALLVQELGDRSFRVRERATRALIATGVPAKTPLLKALESPDAEVRYRARLILSDVLELDLKQRLDEFIDDVSGTREHDLPGWHRFRDVVGDSPAARRLFVEIERHESALIEASEIGPQQASATFEVRCQQIQEGMRIPGRQSERQVPVGSVAAFLFIGADSKISINMQSVLSVTNFCYQHPFKPAVSEGELAPLLKKLVGGWVRRDFASDPTAGFQSMMLALQLNVRDAIEPAMTMLKDNVGNPNMRQYALLVAGKYGEPADVARLEPLLNDVSVCAQQQIPVPASAAKENPPNAKGPKYEVIETQIRDVALAVMLHLSGQKLSDFGFDRVQANPSNLFNTPSLGFADPQQRDAALAKWRQWRASSTAQPN